MSMSRYHSAGHAATKGRSGTKQPKTEVIRLEEFGKACDRFMVRHVPGYRIKNFAGVDVTERVLGVGDVES